MRVRVLAVDVAPLSVPLREPFVIASGRVDTTRAALVQATLADERTGERAKDDAPAGEAPGAGDAPW